MPPADPAVTRAPRSKALWLLAALGILLVAWSAFQRDWSNSAAYACLAVAMILNAAADVKGKQWPRVAIAALVVLAVAIWVLW